MDDDSISVLQGKADQVDRALHLSGNLKAWSTDRRTLYQLYLSYDAQTMVCSKYVAAAVSVLCGKMENHLKHLFDSYDGDADLQKLIPIPLVENSEHSLVANLERMRDGQRDFDIFCILWHKSQPVQQSGPKRGKKDERTFVLPAIRLHVLPMRHPRRVQ